MWSSRIKCLWLAAVICPLGLPMGAGFPRMSMPCEQPGNGSGPITAVTIQHRFPRMSLEGGPGQPRFPPGFPPAGVPQQQSPRFLGTCPSPPLTLTRLSSLTLTALTSHHTANIKSHSYGSHISLKQLSNLTLTWL